MKLTPLRIGAAVRAAGVAFMLTGCGGLHDSFLRLSPTVLVKVPIDEPVPAFNSRGWEFRHVLEAPRDEERRGQWYVAWNNRNPLRPAPLRGYWPELFSRAPELAEAVEARLHVYPMLIEPNLTFTRVASKQPAEPQQGKRIPTEYGEGVRLVINKPLLKVWPDGGKRDPKTGQFVWDPMWHFDAQHSQLALAQKQVVHPGEGIRIGHLDNGLDRRHPASPMKLQRDDWRANVVGLLEYAQARSRGEHPDKPAPPELTGGTHGLGTSGLLAGSWVALDDTPVRGGTIKHYYGWLGGAPYATVVPVKVAPWVISMSTGELAYGIDYASRVQHCDVISMSHGGSPTQAWADAVNAAYERGTAIIAAESDFFSLVPNPFQPRGIILPASPVYPAAFRRVLGVTGATADDRSYARNGVPELLRDITKLGKWAARGSYGADGTSTALFRPSRKSDPSQEWRLGQLRPHPIAAYSPNVPWISMRKGADKTQIADGVDLDGAGTSAATPQVAAAAALWLQKHRDEFSEREWHDWHKAEAVYYALLRSAERHGHVRPDPYLGAGVLRASDALELSLAQIKKAKHPGGHLEKVQDGSLYYGKAPNDYFDGARSFWSIFGLQTWHHVPISQRATLRQGASANDSSALAMQRLYFNMLLLREWHGGDVPRKDVRDEHGNVIRPRHETMYWERAGRMAARLTDS